MKRTAPSLPRQSHYQPAHHARISRAAATGCHATAPDPDLIALVKEFHPAGMPWGEIAKMLNERGLLTARGKPWKHGTLETYARRHGILEDAKPKRGKAPDPELVALVKELRGKDMVWSDIAEACNERGLLSPNGTRWRNTSIATYADRHEIVQATKR